MNIMNLTKVIKEARVHKSRRLAHLFVDFSKAFDMVDRRKLV